MQTIERKNTSPWKPWKLTTTALNKNHSNWSFSVDFHYLLNSWNWKLPQTSHPKTSRTSVRSNHSVLKQMKQMIKGFYHFTPIFKEQISHLGQVTRSRSLSRWSPRRSMHCQCFLCPLQHPPPAASTMSAESHRFLWWFWMSSGFLEVF